MELTRLRLGEIVAGLAAVALLVSLSFDWDAQLDNGSAYIVEPGTPPTKTFTIGASGWSSLGVPVIVLLLVAIGVAFALVFFTVTKRPAALPIGAAVITTFVGVVVTLVLAVRVLLLDDSLGASYLGLLFMALIPAGGWITMADERTHAPYSVAPDLPRRPAPPVEA